MRSSDRRFGKLCDRAPDQGETGLVEGGSVEDGVMVRARDLAKSYGSKEAVRGEAWRYDEAPCMVSWGRTAPARPPA